jgi:hypothetical protein
MILTWNPAKTPWDDDDYLDAIGQTTTGRSVESNWSTGNRADGVLDGDRVFLLRQGREGRGIIASGTASTEIYSAAHWNKASETANYVDLEWECVVAVENRLPTENLRRLIPAQWWQPQSSGSFVKPELVSEFEQLWSDHLARIGRRENAGHDSAPPNVGQGRHNDAERRKKIEDAAQHRLMEHYSRRGWTVTDTRLNNPFDATAEKCAEGNAAFAVSADGTVNLECPRFLYLEAKGTTSPARTVIVTRGEVDHARRHDGQCVMGIWSGIEFDVDDQVDPSSGSFNIVPFQPLDRELSAATYDWSVPLPTT